MKSATRHRVLYSLLKVFFICSAVFVLALLLRRIGVGPRNLLTVFIIAIPLTSAVTRGYLYVAITSLVCVLLHAFFFTAPYYNLHIDDPNELLRVIFFLIMTIIGGSMSSYSYRQAEIAQRNERTTQQMFHVVESFLNVSGTKAIVEDGMNCITSYTPYPCQVQLNPALPGGKPATYQTPGYPQRTVSSPFTLPIKGLANRLGSVTLAGVSLPLPEEQEKLIHFIVYQMALMLDRELINTQRASSTRAAENEKLKNALLRSISHDIRTPLTGILGASATLRDDYASLNEASIKKLAGDINEESAWLIATVQNILDMTRISEGKLAVKKQFEAVDDLISQVVARVPFLTRENRLNVYLPEKVILVEADGHLLVQVLFNLLDNMYKYAGENAVAEIRVKIADASVIFEVSDNGRGIDESILSSLFDCFVTSPQGAEDKGRGVGLGLCICQMIISAHGGEISAMNKPSGGALFTIRLPYKGN